MARRSTRIPKYGTQLLPAIEMANLLGEDFCKVLRAEAYRHAKNKKRFTEIVMDTTQTVERAQLIEKLKSGVIRALQVEGTLPHEFTELYTKGFQNCQGFWVLKGKCRTDDCKEERACNDKQGYCRSCKIAKGLMVAPHVKQKRAGYTFTEAELTVMREREAATKNPSLPNDPLIEIVFQLLLKSNQEGLFEQFVSHWNRMPIGIRLEIVVKAAASSKKVIEFPQPEEANQGA